MVILSHNSSYMHVKLWETFILIVWHCWIASGMSENKKIENNRNVGIKCLKCIFWLFEAFFFFLSTALSCLLHEYSSGYCTICAAYLVKSWYNSWTVCFPCSVVSNLLDTCLCVNVFKNCFCNPSITASSNQFLIGQSCLSTFLVYHSSASPLSLVPKYSTWKSALSSPKRPFSLNHHSIPAMKVSYTLRSGLPEYSAGDDIVCFHDDWVFGYHIPIFY